MVESRYIRAAAGVVGVAAVVGCGGAALTEPAAPPAVVVAPSAPEVEAEPVAKRAPREPVADLAHKWLLKEVRYTDGRPSFTPQTYGGVTLDKQGRIFWSDGCNSIGGMYAITGDQFSVSDVAGTLVHCEAKVEDVEYTSVVRYELDGTRLRLVTPTQIYLLERFPYSPMSEHPWSLYSITEIATGETLNVDRFRMDYYQLYLSVQEDRTFEFLDLDGASFTGTLRVTGEGAVQLALDAASQARLGRRPVQRAPLTDSTIGYQKTKLPYLTTYAQEVDWSAIQSFGLSELAVTQASVTQETEVLDLRSKTHVYRFIPR